MGRTEAGVLWQAAMLFYVFGLVSLYFGGVVITAVLFCIAVVTNLGAVESSCEQAVSRCKADFAERFMRMEGELKTVRRILEEQAAGSNL